MVPQSPAYRDSLLAYMRVNVSDPFKVAAATEALIEHHRNDGAPEAIATMRQTSRALLGVCDLAVCNDWSAHLRSLSWWKRGKASRTESVWRDEQWAKRVAVAEGEVSALAEVAK